MHPVLKGFQSISLQKTAAADVTLWIKWIHNSKSNTLVCEYV